MYNDKKKLILMILLILETISFGGVNLSLYDTKRTDFFNGEELIFSLETDIPLDQKSNVTIYGQFEGDTIVLFSGVHDRFWHRIRIGTKDLRCGQYSVYAEISVDDKKNQSPSIKIGIWPPLSNKFPIFTFGATKYQIPKTLESINAMLLRYKSAGYNEVYYFQVHESVLGAGLHEHQSPELINFLNWCTEHGISVVPMLNSFLYGPMDDDASALMASGNYPTTYVYYNTYKRMNSIRHPRFLNSVKQRMREYFTFASEWPVITAACLDDEPSAFFYNVYGSGRADKAPAGGQWWGQGDYNKSNIESFEKKYGMKPPKYAIAKDVLDKYPIGSIVSENDPWFLWMDFVSKTWSDYYGDIVPTIRDIDKDVILFSEQMLSLNSAWMGTETKSMHQTLDQINFHWIAYGHPIENIAFSARTAYWAVDSKKPMRVMVHTANFNGLQPNKEPNNAIYEPAYVMNQFWTAIGNGAKGIGDQGESDVSLRKDTFFQWKRAAEDITDISGLLLKCKRPKSKLALLYSRESEWMQAVYENHPLDIWRQYHSLEGIAVALIRANIPFDIVDTSDLIKNPNVLNDYEITIGSCIDYALEDIYKSLKKTKTTLYLTPSSAIKLSNARRLIRNYDEIYKLFRDAEIRDRRTYYDLMDRHATKFKELFREIKLNVDALSEHTLVFELDAPGSKLITVVNNTNTWTNDTPISKEILMKVRKIVGEDVNIPSGSVDAKPITAKVFYNNKDAILYDLRKHEKVAATQKEDGLFFERELSGGEGTLVLAVDSPITSLILSVDDQCIEMTAMDNEGKRLSWTVPIKIEVYEPDGKLNQIYTKNDIIENGRLFYEIDFAKNDPQGHWNVFVTELASGIKTQTVIDRAVKLAQNNGKD